MKFKCLFIERYEVSNDTVMVRLQKDTYGRDFNLESALCRDCKQNTHVLGNDCDIVFISLKSTEKVQRRGNSVMFMLLHWYCHRSLGCGKMIKFISKIFNIFGDVCTRDGTISLCQRDSSAQIVMSHNYSTQVSDPFCSPPPWSPNNMIVRDICQYIMCPI